MTADGLYVYGVAAADTPSSIFANVGGVEPSQPVVLVAAEQVAAIASRVPLDEYGETALEQNLRDPAWLEEKVLAHDRVLEAAVGRATVIPFRFGTIYKGAPQLEEMLRSRTDLVPTLSRLNGAVEFGVKGFLDQAAFRAEASDAGAGASSGRDYMQRKQQERSRATAAVAVANERALDSHSRLAATAADARTNPLQSPELAGPDRVMFLNAAYLVRAGDQASFAAALAVLRESYADEGVVYELTGPWPPYNFAGGNEP